MLFSLKDETVKNVSFLVVDDNQSFRSIVKSTINDQLGSLRVISAVNGLIAKLILQKQTVDIVISDVDMPRLDGFELLSFMRSHPKLKHIPFIMMTPEDSKEFVCNAIEQGVTEYLVKPFTIEKLEDAIRRSWYGAEQRRNGRISNLPSHTLEVSFSDGHTLNASVVNISASGIRYEVQYIDEIRLFSKCSASLSVDISKTRTVSVETLVCDIVRVEAVDFSNSHSRRCYVAVSVNDVESGGNALNDLNRLIDVLTREGTSQSESEFDSVNELAGGPDL
ncbi:response regulator [Marinomonas mediterranea]|nr:response regulator [Marinomonas mediterranea]WCN14162.1 response regulator [Marinomonas mediterranea]